MFWLNSSSHCVVLEAKVDLETADARGTTEHPRRSRQYKDACQTQGTYFTAHVEAFIVCLGLFSPNDSEHSASFCYFHAPNGQIEQDGGFFVRLSHGLCHCKLDGLENPGRLVVLVHGMAGSEGYYRYLTAYLTNKLKRRVLRFDNYGCVRHNSQAVRCSRAGSAA